MSTSLPLHAGKKGERLPDGENTIRLVKKTTSEGKVPPDEFQLSTLDQQMELKSLSVWAERLTSPHQAREFMRGDKESCTLYFRLNVDDVRSLRPIPDEIPEILSLDVVWDPLTVTQDLAEVPDTRPGAEGHSGITGLFRQSHVPRSYFFSLRSQLADLANKTTRNIS